MHRRCYAFLIALPLLIVTAIWQVDIKTDISAFFMVGDSPQAALVASNMQTGALSRRYLLSVNHFKLNDKPVEFIEELRGEFAKIEGVDRIWGEGLREDEIHELITFYLPYRYHLFTLTPESDVAAAFSKEALVRRAAAVKEGLLSPEAQWMKTILAEDPMFLISNWLGRFSTHELNKGAYASLVIETAAAGLDTASQKPIRKQIEEAFERINIAHGNRYRLTMTGVPLFAMAVQEQVARDVMLVSSISIVAMGLLFVFLFRSLTVLVFISLTLAASATVATIITSMVFGQIHALTLALGSTLIGVCVDYPIHTIVHVVGGNEKPPESAKRIWLSLLLGALTTVVGYAALSFTGYPGMQQIALYAGAGILTSLFISRFVLPYAIERHSKAINLGFNFTFFLNFANARKLKIPVMFGSLLFLLFGLSGINWQSDLSSLSPSLESLKESDRQVRSRMQSIEPGRFVLLHADTIEQALQINEAALLVLEKVKAAGKLSAYHSIYPWMASQALQQQNVHAFAQHLNSENIAQWRVAVDKIGIRSASLKDPVIPDAPALSIDDITDSPVGRYIAGQYVIGDHGAILTIWLGAHDAEAVRQALAPMTQARYVSQKDMMNEMNAAYTSKAIEALAYGALVILLLLTLRYRRPAIAMQALSPAMASVAIVLGCWGISGQPLGMLHLVGLLLAVAICVDYGIFFIENRAHDIRLTYQAIVVSAMTTMVAFSCLALAENPALQTLAWTIAPGVFFGFFLCPLLIQPKQFR
ncbi:MAG: MMPL family transporter [Mariprofundaceae bacterium]